MFAKPELAHISSSAVKVLQQETGFISEYVPLLVKQLIEEKLSGQFIVGLTGEIGTGKSYVGKKFEELGVKQGVEVHNIEVDHLAHDILSSNSLPLYAEARKAIVDRFGFD